MHDLLLSPISTDILVEKIAQRTAEMILSKQPVQTEPQNEAEQLLTFDELAELLHISKTTAYSNYSKGLIPGGCKQGKRVLFDKQIILSWIKSGRKLSNAEIEQQAETYLTNKRMGGRKNG